MWSQTLFISSIVVFLYGGLRGITGLNEIHILTFRHKQDRTCTKVYTSLFKRCIDGNPACVSDGVIVKTASAQLQVVLAEETVTDVLLKVFSEMTQDENIHRLPQTFAQLVGKIL